jgi:hypothetical protein
MTMWAIINPTRAFYDKRHDAAEALPISPTL